MRRKDREITDFDTIIRMIGECEILRLGLADGDFPYIVPVNFGFTVKGQKVIFYIHGAMAGRKYELLSRNPRCSFEMDVPLELDCDAEKKEATMRYRSVMGKASVQFLEGEEKLQAMNFIMARYAQTRDFEYSKAPLPRTAVAKLTVLEMTAKENPVRTVREKGENTMSKYDSLWEQV